MQNIEKRKNQYFKTFLFRQVESTISIAPLYCAIVLLNLIADALVIIEFVSKNTSYINFAVEILFYLQPVILGLLFLVGLLSCFIDVFRSVWVYSTMLLQSVSMLFIRNLCISLQQTPPSFYTLPTKISQISIFLVFTLAIIILKNNTYYPFQNVSHLFSMRQENTSVFLLLFRIILCLVLYGNIVNSDSSNASNQNQGFKVIVFVTFLFFWKMRNSGYLNQVSKKLWDIYSYAISWTIFVLFISANANLINDRLNMKVFQNQLSFQQTFIYLWCYTFPFVIVLPLYNGTAVQSNFWQNMFLVYDHQFQRIYNKEQVYVLCDQLRQYIDDLKKSQFRYKDPQFKKLWSIVNKHKTKCLYSLCPFHELTQFNEEATDQYFQHRKFLKTLKCTLQFIRLSFAKLKNIYPDVLEVELQIAHFYLVALKNKQQGMILYNEYSTKRIKKAEKSSEAQSSEKDENLTKDNEKRKNDYQQVNKSSKSASWSEKYAIFYLKKKIDKIFVGEQQQANANMDNQISEFRQKIEVSVTMLAQFWSLLADPKCNLKKMYDLANILFPLKMGLQQDWQKIKLLKNVQIYGVYAKYLIRMFNDKENGLKIFEQAKKIDYQMRNKEQILLDDKGGPIVQENGIVFMSYDGKNSGVMYQVNVNAQKIFGYGRGQLLNKKVNDIMPSIFAVEHDRILENYQQTNQSSMMNKQRNVWGKSKDGFIFPFTILIKPILSFYSQSTNSQVYANIKRDIYLKQMVGIVIDNEQTIRQYSSNALRLFPLLQQHYNSINIKPLSYRQKMIASNRQTSCSTVLKIQNIIPNFSEIREKVLIQNEQCQIKIQRVIKTSRNSNQSFIETCVFSVHISQLNVRVCGKLGCLIKLFKIGTSQFVPVQQNQQCKNQGKEHFLTTSPEIKDNEGESGAKDKSKVKFQINQEQQAQKRGFIFSYDMTEKMKNFTNSAKKIESLKLSKPLTLTKSQKKMLQQSKIHPREIAPRQRLHSNIKGHSYEMAYVGGFTKTCQILQKIKTETVSTFRAQLKVTQQQYQDQRTDYGTGIKTKRLQDNMVREMREQEVELEYKKNSANEQQREQGSIRPFSEIKPSELNQITEKSSKNRLIMNLRILTVFLLICCSVMAIVQYSLLGDRNRSIHQEMLKIKKLGEIRTEILSINFYVNYLVQFASDSTMSFVGLHASIDELNQYINNFKFASNTLLKYSDGSTQDYYLGFALNKLISQANSLTLNSSNLISKNDPSTFFIRHNTLNGLSVSLDQQQILLLQSIQDIKQSIKQMSLIFLATSISLSFTIILIKNILLRFVMSRKTEILEIFFQIPRASCSRIQKQCQLFILQLSATNQEDEIQYVSTEEQFEGMNKGNGKTQKKRTSVGEQNTSFQFSIVSVVFMVFLLFFQLFIITKNSIDKPSVDTLTSANTLFFNLEYKLFQLSVFIDSYHTDSTIPLLNNANSLALIKSLKQNFTDSIKTTRQDFYQLQQIFPNEIDQKLSTLYFKSVCNPSCPSSSSSQTRQQKNGLNSLISKYIQLIKQHYNELSQQIISDIENYVHIKSYQLSMKQYWRKFTLLISQAEYSYVMGIQNVNLWVLVSFCVLCLVAVLLGWMWYYWGLEDKITATEYILAFIPIDEINKNGKIANYIREQILNKKM